MLGLVALCTIVKRYCRQYFNYIVAYINLTFWTQFITFGYIEYNPHVQDLKSKPQRW